jgi:hypothetical protein
MFFAVMRVPGGVAGGVCGVVCGGLETHFFTIPLLAAPAAALGVNHAGASAAAAGVVGHVHSPVGLQKY